MTASLVVNGRTYRRPSEPTIVVCVDGCEPAYVDDAIATGIAPALRRFHDRGTHRLSRSVVPSFTNPNNLSIVTGVCAAVHGISGNYFWDAAAGQEVMMNEPRFLRCPTLLAELSRAGDRVVVITAKDKLRRLLSHGMRGICFSSEKAGEVTKAEHGIERVTDLVPMPIPDVYSAELSEYVLAAGLELLRRERPDVMYLSLTDYVQHKHPPGDPVARAFYAMLDRYFDAFDREGARLGITGDHGMNAKVKADGTPNVVYLAPLLESVVGGGGFRVILPITDPYVVHHGALGSFATVHLDRPADVAPLIARLRQVPGVAGVWDRAEGCRRFELPPDRMGDVIAVGDRHTALGKSPEAHDLSLLEEPLRSHGGPTEETVPFIVNRPLSAAWTTGRGELRNFDMFDGVLNGIEG
jgi:phosphonoacetate hydrolase